MVAILQLYGADLQDMHKMMANDNKVDDPTIAGHAMFGEKTGSKQDQGQQRTQNLNFSQNLRKLLILMGVICTDSNYKISNFCNMESIFMKNLLLTFITSKESKNTYLYTSLTQRQVLWDAQAHARTSSMVVCSLKIPSLLANNEDDDEQMFLILF